MISRYITLIGLTIAIVGCAETKTSPKEDSYLVPTANTSVEPIVEAAATSSSQGESTMPDRDGKGHFDRIMKYVDVQMGGDSWGYDEAIAKLRDHPPGYRRSLCIYFSDADIDNGGFQQYYQNGFGCMTMSAIEGYERLGATP